MAVKKIPVPFCDWCGLPFLPKFRLKDGTQNPIFYHPEKSKRCGKCKRTGWNAGGVDRRRKSVPKVESAASAPLVDAIKASATPDSRERPAPGSAPRARRCRHGLYKCEKCHGEQAA
jgi:hypothetical protein